MITMPRTLILVDGENITFQLQRMLVNEESLKKGCRHIRDVLAWSSGITQLSGWFILRVNYYTSAVGCEETLRGYREQISKIPYSYHTGSGFLNPHVFKKSKQAKKTKIVDINIIIDLLRHTYNGSIDQVFLLSGDGDYIPAIKEAMHHGIQVFVGALSLGLNKELPLVCDEFFDLDRMFFG